MIRLLDAHPWAVIAIVGVACVWFALWCLIVVGARADVMGCESPESPQGRHCDCYREAGEACCWCARKSPFAEEVERPEFTCRCGDAAESVAVCPRHG